MREKTIHDIIQRIKNTLNSQRYRNNLNNPKVNWIDIPINNAIDRVIEYIGSLEKIVI